MTTNEPRYEVVPGGTALTQGDLIFQCPLLTWDPALVGATANSQIAEALKPAATGFRADVVIMTQACDLEHHKVRNVVLCPHVGLSTFHNRWEKAMQQQSQNPTAKAWRNTCDDIADGYLWNHAMLAAANLGPPEMHGEIRVVDFHEVFTVPRLFLESLLTQRGTPRLRLLPPYREHLSQAFARFFMRVGLPEAINRTW